MRAYRETEGNWRKPSYGRSKLDYSPAFVRWKWWHRNRKTTLLIGFVILFLAAGIWGFIGGNIACKRVSKAADHELVGYHYRSLNGGEK